MSAEQKQHDEVARAAGAEHFEEGEEAPPPGVRTMALVRWLLVLAMAAAALLSIHYVYRDTSHAEGHAHAQYYCPMHPSVVQDQPGECPICGMTLVLRETPAEPKADGASGKVDHTGHRHVPSDPYRCPMHPEETGLDASARCPLCGMKLEKMPAPASAPAPSPAPVTEAPKRLSKKASKQSTTPSSAAPAEPAAPTSNAPVQGLTPVQIPEQRIQLIGMRTAKVQRAALPTELKVVGYVAPTESGLAVIQTRFSGWIEELLVAETGQLVQRGQLLARIYSPELLAAQEELLNARKWTGAATPSHSALSSSGDLAESARRRLALMGMESSEIAAVEKSGAPHRLIEIRSPARGYVAQKSAVQGMYIQPGSRLFEIADLSKVWLFVELFERDAGRIRAGQSATLQLTAYPGERFAGKVQLVYPTLDVATRTQRARIEFRNPDLRLRPGMYGEVWIQEGAAEGLVVPREAVVDTGEQQYVFLAEAGGLFTPRAVSLGQRFQDQVQILSGLREGETVVTTGNFLIDSESRLRAVLDGRAGHNH